MKKLLLLIVSIYLFWSCGRESNQDNTPTPPNPEEFNLGATRWYVRDGKIFQPSGKEWRGVGTNLTNLMGRDGDFIRMKVEREARMGFSYIRLWTPNHNSTGPIDMEARANQVVNVMNVISQFGMKTMIVFWDTYMDLWGKEHAYHRDPQWFKEGYKGDFLKWVKILTNKVKNHPSLFMYQLVNESSCRLGCAADYINMYASTAATIRSIDPNHLISPGSLSVAHAMEGGSFGGSVDKFVQTMLQKDDQIVWTTTLYNRELPNRNDLPGINKRIPVIITEYGFCRSSSGTLKGVEAFAHNEWGAKAMFNKWSVSGIAAWEAEESNCGYANNRISGFDLTEQFKNLAKEINK